VDPYRMPPDRTVEGGLSTNSSTNLSTRTRVLRRVAEDVVTPSAPAAAGGRASRSERLADAMSSRSEVHYRDCFAERPFHVDKLVDEFVDKPPSSGGAGGLR
jgi:hypothetical protein